MAGLTPHKLGAALKTDRSIIFSVSDGEIVDMVDIGDRECVPLGERVLNALKRKEILGDAVATKYLNILLDLLKERYKFSNQSATKMDDHKEKRRKVIEAVVKNTVYLVIRRPSKYIAAMQDDSFSYDQFVGCYADAEEAHRMAIMDSLGSHVDDKSKFDEKMAVEAIDPDVMVIPQSGLNKGRPIYVILNKNSRWFEEISDTPPTKGDVVVYRYDFKTGKRTEFHSSADLSQDPKYPDFLKGVEVE